MSQNHNPKIETLKAEIRKLEEDLFELENQAYLKNQDPVKKQAWLDEDNAFLKRATQYQHNFNALAPSFFGYPGNLTQDSPLVARLRQLEARMFYINNAGDPYEQGDSALDGKVFERELLRLFFDKFEMDEKSSWGYVTSGGSESNTWGILNGFRKYPGGRLYFCEAAHYSVMKAVTNGSQALLVHTVIAQKSSRDERIDTVKLFESIKAHWEKDHQAPILLLTWGTTKMGWCDEVDLITRTLTDRHIPYYLHVDAAYFGGIPNNQADAPICPSLKAMKADSVSVSFHKFFGVPNINSVVLSKDKADGNYVSYLGHRDTTVSGSRTFAIFSGLQRIKEVLQRSDPDDYRKNIMYFETALNQQKLPYFRAPLSSIFVIPLPSLTLRTRYHLASFEGASGQVTLAHVIVNPFHQQQDLDDLIRDLKADGGTTLQPLDLLVTEPSIKL